MNDATLELVNLIVGFVAPLAVSFIKRCEWSQQRKVAATMGICAAFGIMVALAGDELSVGAFADRALKVFAYATGFYKLYFERTELNTKLEDLK